MTGQWQLAQINIAAARFPHDDARMGPFFQQLDHINALAESSPGFVWRLQSDTGNATDIRVGDDPRLIVNMSVWQSVESLFDFAYKTAHRRVLADRQQWFERPNGVYQALWYVAAGQPPTVDEGVARLALLQEIGPGPEAFTFKNRFAPPGATTGSEPLDPEPLCSAWQWTGRVTR